MKLFVKISTNLVLFVMPSVLDEELHHILFCMTDHTQRFTTKTPSMLTRLFERTDLRCGFYLLVSLAMPCCWCADRTRCLRPCGGKQPQSDLFAIDSDMYTLNQKRPLTSTFQMVRRHLQFLILDGGFFQFVLKPKANCQMRSVL